jgi:hypothetical protein
MIKRFAIFAFVPLIAAAMPVQAQTFNKVQSQALMSGRLDDKVMQHITIGGRPALSAIADYVSAGQKMVEHVTWVDGEILSAIVP